MPLVAYIPQINKIRPVKIITEFKIPCKICNLPSVPKIKIDPKNKANMPTVMGCNALYERLQEVGETVWFDKVCGGGHGSFDWGMLELNRRMANFCYLVMNNQLKTGEFIFIPQKSSCPGKTFPDCEKWKKK